VTDLKPAFLRIKDIQKGFGPCNDFEGNEICGKDGEWIASTGMRQAPGSKAWEPLRYCRRHWKREVARLAKEDQEEAFVKQYGYPEGATLWVMVAQLGLYIVMFQTLPEGESEKVRKWHEDKRQQSFIWMRNWMLRNRDIKDQVLEKLNQFKEQYGDDDEITVGVYAAERLWKKLFHEAG
jgi:hypothetical protein